MAGASEQMQKYFESIQKQVDECYSIANSARKQGYDPEDRADVRLAKNMAERVEGLVSSVAPALLGTGFTKRIVELEKTYSPLDWRVALKLAEEVAKEKFCRFKDKREAMEVGIRAGFTYHTGGIVSAPLEGFTRLGFKKTRDGKDYLVPHYSGPIRGAGGTAAAFSLVLTDYIRTVMGYAGYDPDERETGRYKTEISDYHDRVTNLQYKPSEDEIEFLVGHLPIEIDGDPTEKIEVSNYKDLDRVETNRIRGGISLVLAEGLAQKAPKLWKRLGKWGKDFSLDWGWLEEFIALQKSIKAKQKKEDKKKEGLTPNYTFIADLVAGRPVLAHPMARGGFRLRYGRSRVSGFSAASINPATMLLLKRFIATGTQLKMERPGKAASITPCDTIDGPTIKTADGSVLRIRTAKEAKAYKGMVSEILFLGDVLFNYGDFSENGHVLAPAGYNEEWWLRELEKASVDTFGTLDMDKLAEMTRISHEDLEKLFKNPFRTRISARAAINISQKLDVAMHPDYTYYWRLLKPEDIAGLARWVSSGKAYKEEGKLTKLVLSLQKEGKAMLENIGLPHKLVNKEFVVVERDHALSLMQSLGFGSSGDVDGIISKIDKERPVLDNLSRLAGIRIMDKAGTFIGARMGRPEKAKMRKMAGTPHVLFPIGDEGGRLRSFQSAIEAGFVTAELPTYYCPECKKDTIFAVCETCNKKTEKRYLCEKCGVISEPVCRKKDSNGEHGPARPYREQKIEIKHYFQKALEKIGDRIYPDLIKGVRGTSNRDHLPEHIIKGILRAKHDVFVNKDGTVRFDMTELPITHFKPEEIGCSLEKLKQLGYTQDIKGAEITSESQIIEIMPQDIVLPAAPDALDEQSDKALVRVAGFIDELLVKLYGLKPYYNIKSREDLIGQVVVGLAPHISAGTVGRIIGFSKTQGMFAHPLFHAALRRDCFSKDAYIPLYIDGRWQIRPLGEVVEQLNPTRVVDDFGTKEARVKGISSAGLAKTRVNNFTRHTPQPMVEIKTQSGKTLKTTHNHKHIVFDGKEKLVLAHELKIGDKLCLPYRIKIAKKDIKKLDLLSELSDRDWAMVRGVNRLFDIKKYARARFSKKDYDNFTSRDSYPVAFISDLIKKHVVKPDKLFLAAKRDHVQIPAVIPVSKELLQIIGLYVAEGYSRAVKGGHYQVYIAAQDKGLRGFIKSGMKQVFGLSPAENKDDRVTYSSRILYEFFVSMLGCGSSAQEKRLPARFLDLPNKRLGHLLSGYFEGDGSVSKSDTRVTFDTVSEGLLKDMDFVFAQMGIFVKNYTYSSYPGKRVRDFYIRKDRAIPKFTVTKGIIQSIFVRKFAKYAGFISSRKKDILRALCTKIPLGIRQEHSSTMVFDKVTSVKLLPPETSYSLNVEGNRVFANSILTKQCDGDEACVILLMDALLNFSRQYLPDSRGAKTMDAPLVLTSKLVPSEVDDMAHGLDIVWEYPLELYNAAQQMKDPWELKVEQIKHVLGTERQYEKMGFTHDVASINSGINCSAYKALPSMEEKLKGQMALAERIRAVDASDVARLVIEKHLLRDTKGNLRKFSTQQFRCVKCNKKYRRPPLIGRCSCGGRLIFTVSHGSVIKYLEPSVSLAEKYEVPLYLKQSLDLLRLRIDGVFGKEKEVQEGLGRWFG